MTFESGDITFGSEDKILPMKTYFEKQIFHRNYDTGNLELDLDLLREFHLESYESFVANPEEWIKIAKKSIKETLELIPEKKDSKGVLIEASTLPKNILNFKIKNLKNILTISEIRKDDMGKIYKISGIIKRITTTFTRTKDISFECSECGSILSLQQSQKRIVTPSRCSCGNKGKFIEKSKSKINIQELNLEEMPEEIAGKQPQQLRVYLEDYLTDPTLSERLQPGKRIEITGIIKQLPPFMTKSDTEENISGFMLHAHLIDSLEEEDEISISDEDKTEIEKIAKDNPLKKLSQNLASSIYGHEVIKKAIILQLVKGAKKARPDGTQTRGDLHILLVGDPGQAKSVILKATSLRSPRSRYVSGTRSSSVGLTIMVKKDELSGQWCLEAGVIVLCHGSIVCLDEIDKVDKEQLSTLYEPLETQTVTIAKAGIAATLYAETSILAAANPIHGKFDFNQPITTQINLPPPLLNRFDLVFVLIDRQKDDYDKQALSHLFKIHKEEIVQEEPISILLFKKFISYARKINPILEDDIYPELERIYLKIRRQSVKEGSGVQGLPINLRNAEGLIRLATANAKIRLSKKVELEDLKVAEEIFMYSLKQIGYDESGILDMSRVSERVPVSKLGKMERVKAMIRDLTKRLGKDVPYHELIQEAESIGIQAWEAETYIEELNRIGEIISPTKGYWRITI